MTCYSSRTWKTGRGILIDKADVSCLAGSITLSKEAEELLFSSSESSESAPSPKAKDHKTKKNAPDH